MSATDAERMAAARRKLLEKRLKAKRASAEQAPPIPRQPAAAPIPATHGQQSLWYMQQLVPASATYNVLHTTRLRGTIDVEALHRSFDTIVARHEILRTNFALHDGELHQIVRPPNGAHFAVQDVALGQMDATLRRHAQSSFDLAEDALLRVTLLCESATDAVLLIMMHHIIGDQWSLDVLLWRELVTCYTAYTQGIEPELPTVEAQFRDFAAWQHSKVGTERYQKQMAYWRDYLAAAPARLELPLDHSRPPQQAFTGEVLYGHLAAEQTEQLQALSRETNTTLFVTLLSAFTVLLQRWSRQNDVTVGTVADMRTHSQLEHTIGYLLNTLVLYHDFEATSPFTDVLTAVRDQMLQSLANREVEFDQLVKVLQPQRDPSYNPVFQTMFVMWDGINDARSLPGLVLEPFKFAANVAKFDLTLYVQVESDNRLLLAIEYASSLFERDTIQRLLQVFQTLLHSIGQTPTAPIAQLDWLPTAQRQILLDEWTQTAQSFPDEALVHDLIAAHADNAPAIKQNHTVLTYGELNVRANQIAHHLRAAGVEPNTPVGLLVERSPELLVGIVGILRAGAAYVPLDPDYPDERIQFILNDAGITLLLMQTHIDQAVPDTITKLHLDSAIFADYPVTPPPTTATPDDLAYIIYTSGSTGQPKGVRATHRNLVHSTTARYSVYEHPLERFLLLSSFAFDSSLVGIFWSLCSGGTLCLPAPNAERDVAEIAQLIRDERITHLLALPSLYSILLDFAAADALQTLNTVMVAGEACSLTLVSKHYAQLPSAKLYNEYGPTEGTVWATVWDIPHDTQHMSIGRVIPNMQTYIVDGALAPVPIGMVGELLLGGAGITHGYHNRPGLTTERFIDNPFGNGRLYRTGDLARYRPDGTLEFWGRADHQVKISGYRVELGEIEAALHQLPAVREAIVLLHTEPGTASLVGFAVTEADKLDLQAALRERLPRYMVPAQIITLDDLPRTPNGKIDRKALLKHIPAEQAVSDERIQGQDAVEEQLVAIWEDLLGKPVPSLHADFFDLGGYSLLAIRMLAQVKQALGSDLPVSTILESPTIAKLAVAVRDVDRASKTLITLQAEGAAAPLYCFQVNRFGGLLHYQTLVKLMGQERPIYGLALPLADDEPMPSMAVMAQRFAEALRQQPRQEKYYFVGTSAAGLVAYETARLLQADGCNVHVIMIDTNGPGYPVLQPPSATLRQKVPLIGRELLHAVTSGELNTWLGGTAWMLRYRSSYQLRKRTNWVLAKLGLPLIGNGEEALAETIGVQLRRQIDEYFSEERLGIVPIMLYRARLKPITSEYEWALRWDRYVAADKITTHPVIGPHRQLLKQPFVVPIVEHLQQWLAEDEQQSSE